MPTLPKKTLVQPGIVKKSYLAQKILNEKIVGLPMPQGCPNLPPAGGCPSGAEGGCLDNSQFFAILAWIQGGALDN